MTYDTHPVCSKCGTRIELFGRMWVELSSGTIRASYAVDLDDRHRQARGLWHPGCVPAQHQTRSH